MASLILFPLGLVVGVFAEAVAIEVPLRDLRERSNRVWLVSLATGGLFAVTPLVVGVTWLLPAYLWFVSVTVTLTLTDIDSQLIPNRVLYPGTAIALALLYTGSLAEGGALLRPLLGGAAYYLLLLVLALVGPAGGMGGGDVKLGFLLGAFTAYPSWSVFITSILSAFILGGLVSLILIVTRVRDRKEAIAFGPFLVLGAYVALAWGATVADWYLG